MISGNKPIPTKQFCKFWLLSVIVSGLFIYPALTIGFLNLGGKLPGLDGAKKAFTVKNKIAGQFRDMPVLYVVGGSSAYYGIDAALMESRLDRTVINYGVHAGLGLSYQLFQLKKVLKAGDSVLLAFELDLLSDNNDVKSDFLHAYVATYDKRYFFQDDWKKLSKAVYTTPFSDWKLSITQWINLLAGKSENRDTIKMPHLLIGKRGDTRYKQHNSRPLILNKYVGLGRQARKALISFSSSCTKMGIRIYFTWETAVRHPDYFDERADEYRHTFLSFFSENNFVALDEYTDHLYPESLFSNTYNHLNMAGRRIRTEKLIHSFQQLSANGETTDGRKDLYLIEIANHEAVSFDFNKGKDFDFRVYSTAETPDADIIDDEGIEKLLHEGMSVYFNDPDLKHLLVFKKADVKCVETDYRTLSDSLHRYPNHVFFIIQNGYDLPWDKDACSEIKPMADFFKNEGYRVAVIGTGLFSSIKKIVIQKQPIQMLLKKDDMVGSFRLPFNVRLESGAVSLSGRNQGRVRIGDADFSIPMDGHGIWCVVYDPDLGVVSDRFFYEHPGKNIEAELYCAKSALH